MKLQKFIKEVIGTEWTTSRDLAEIFAKKYPEELKKKYHGKISALSMALGPSLYALGNLGLIENDGTEWPATKSWRRVRVHPREPISVDDVAKALIKLHLATDKAQAIRMLAARTIRENRAQFKEWIEEVSRINEESTKIGKKLLGLK